MATSAVSMEETAREIRAMDSEFARHANSGDAVAMVESFYAEDAQLLPPNAPKLTGKAAILEFWKAFMTAGPSGMDLQTTDISGAGDLAYGVGKYSMTLAGAQHKGKYVVVYRRQPNGRYKAIVDMFSGNA